MDRRAVTGLSFSQPTGCADAARLEAHLLAHVHQLGGTRAAVDIGSDPSVLEPNPTPDDPTTALVIIGGAASAVDPIIARAVERCRRTMRACIPVFDPRSDFADQQPANVHELNGVPWRAGDHPKRRRGSS